MCRRRLTLRPMGLIWFEWKLPRLDHQRPFPLLYGEPWPAAWVVAANHNPAYASGMRGAMLKAIKDKLDPGACRWNFVCEQHPGSLCTNASRELPDTSRRRRNGFWEGQYHSGIILALLSLQVG